MSTLKRLLLLLPLLLRFSLLARQAQLAPYRLSQFGRTGELMI